MLKFLELILQFIKEIYKLQYLPGIEINFQGLGGGQNIDGNDFFSVFKTLSKYTRNNKLIRLLDLTPHLEDRNYNNERLDFF